MPDLTASARLLRERIATALDLMPAGARRSADLDIVVPLADLRTVLEAVDQPADEWVLTTDRLPDTDDVVMVRTATGDIRNLRWMSGMWFLADRSMYVCFDVEAWKAL